MTHQTHNFLPSTCLDFQGFHFPFYSFKFNFYNSSCLRIRASFISVISRSASRSISNNFVLSVIEGFFAGKVEVHEIICYFRIYYSWFVCDLRLSFATSFVSPFTNSAFQKLSAVIDGLFDLVLYRFGSYSRLFQIYLARMDQVCCLQNCQLSV